MSRRKGPVEKIRPFEGDKEIAERISAHLEGRIDVVTILSIALSAGLRAIKNNNYEMPMPLRLIVDPTPRPSPYPDHPNTDEQVLIEDRTAGKRTLHQKQTRPPK